MTDYSLTKHRVFQWIGIILIIGLFAVAYWYFKVQGSTLSKSPTGSITGSLVGYWTFDASSTTSSTATDQGTGGNNGTLTNSPAQGEGKNGQGLDFFPNGSDNNSYVTMGDPADGDLDFGSNDFTVSFWMKGQGFSSQGESLNVALAKRNVNLNVNAGYSFSYASTNIMSFLLANGTTAYILSSPVATVNDKAWHHYVGVRSGGTAYFYIDSTVAASDTTVTGSTSNSESFFVGTAPNPTPNGKNVNAIIDEVRVYNAAITASQVQSLYALGASDKINSAVVASQGTGRLDSGLNGYWPLDDNTGTTASDESTNNNDGTLTNGPTWTTGQLNYAVDFDDTDDYISVPDASHLDFDTNANFALTGWFYRDAFATDDTIIAKRNGIANTDDGYILYIDDSTDKLTFEVSENSGTDEYQLASVSTFTSTGWNHFAVMWDQSSAGGSEIYINGRADGATDSGSTLANVGDLDNAVVLAIGAESDAGNPFDGKLDEIRLYNRVLTPDEVTQLYRLTTPTGVDTTLKGYWTFDGQDTYVTTILGRTFDRSGAGHTGSLSNTPSLIEGVLGQGVQFSSGGSEAVTLGDQPVLDVSDTEDLTIAGWVSRESFTTDDAIVSKRSNSGAQGYSVWFDDTTDQMYFELHDGTDEYQIRTVQTFTTAGWFYFTAVWDQDSATNSAFYINGVSVNVTKTGTIGNIGDLTNSNGFSFCSNNGSPDFCDASLDEIRLYKRALGATEAQSLYEASKPDTWNSSVSQLQGTGRLDSGLVAYYKLDDASGTNADDATGNGNDGTLANFTGGSEWTTGQIGGAVDCDGSDDAITIADANSLDIAEAVTLSAWIKKDAHQGAGGTDMILIKGDSGAPAVNYSIGTYGVSSSDERLRFSYYSAATTHTSHGSTSLATGTWYHVAITYNDTANLLQLYVNGSLESLTTLSGDAANNSIAGNSYDMDIGNSDGASHFDGQIDEVRVYSRTFSVDEIGQLYRLGTPTGTETSLKGYWSFNGQDLSGTAAYDRSGAGNTGTLTNGAAIAEGKIGQGVDLDGSNDYVSVADNAALDIGDTDDLTLMGWFNRDSSNTDDTLIAKRNGIANTNQGYIAYIDDATDRITFEVCDAASACDEYQVESISTFTSAGWNHFAIVWDQDSDSASEIYINGVDDNATDTGTIGNIGDLSNTVVLAVGAESDAGNAFDGKLDEIRVYKRALSAAEIAALYNQSR